MKSIFKIVGIAVAILIVVLIALPFLVNVNHFRPQIEAQLSGALGRQVGVGNLSLSLLSGSVVADNITIGDDPAFSKAPFVTAKSLKVGVELMPLIFSKQLHVTEITLEQPEIALLKAASGKWNFSSIGGKQTAEPPKAGGTTPANLSVAKLAVNDGRLIVGKANSPAKPQIYDKVNISVENFSFTAQFPFKLSANLPGGGDVKISGKAGPISAEDAAKTPLETEVKVSGLDIGASGFIDAASGITGLADFDGTLTSNGSQAQAVGTFTGSKLKFSPKGTPASQKLVVKHAVDLDLNKQSGILKQGDIVIGKASAHLTGNFQTQGQTQILNMRLSAPDLPVDDLQALLPSLGIILPSGSQLKGGTLSANLGIAGPVDKLVITGPVRLSNTKLANFNLGAKLAALSAFTGKTASDSDTSIQNFSLNARMAPEGTRADSINLSVPAIGLITGAGMVSPAGALNFKMLANLQGGMAGGLTQMAGLGSGKSSIPFSIAGTTSSPQFVPDMKGVATGVAQGVLGQFLGGKKDGGTQTQPNPIDAIGGLFGKKKK